MTELIDNPERFDPESGTGRLIDSEHRARYWWAAAIARGKDVLDAGCGVGYGIGILASCGAKSITGIDVSAEAVEEATAGFGAQAEAVVEGTLAELPFDDASFDLVLCFEVIEHLEDADKALGELRRVLRPDGVLIVSTPNPDVYLAGNEHHLHEFRPDELADAVGRHFEQVASYRQDPLLGTTIEALDGDRVTVRLGRIPRDPADRRRRPGRADLRHRRRQ